MKAEMLSRAHRVGTPEAGAFFANSRTRRILMMFANEPLSLKEASDLSGIELKRLHHYVQRLVRAGLVQVESVRPRSGRAIKVYRAVAEMFFVANEFLPRSSTEEIASELRGLLQSDEARGSIGILVAVGARMEPKVEFVLSDERERRGFEFWRILRLRREEFERLRQELDVVLSRYQEPHDERGDVYLLHAAGVPRRDAEGVVDNRSSGSA